MEYSGKLYGKIGNISFPLEKTTDDIENDELLLKKAINALDDYLNAGNKEQRKKAAIKAKEIYKEYHGKEYTNRND